MNNMEINKARAIYYGLFSSLFSYFENIEEYKKVVYTTKLLNESPLDETSKLALEKLVSFLEKENSYELLQEENNNIFFSPSTSFVPVTASYYAENRDDGEKRLQMCDFVLKSKFRKDSKVFKEAEDHMAFIFAFLQKQIEQDLSSLLNENVIEVFSTILNVVVDEFIEKVYHHENSEFYKNLAVLLKVFIEIERVLLNISKPKLNDKKAEHNIFHQKKKGFTKKAKRNFDEVTSL